MKIKSNSDDELPLNIAVEIASMTIIVRAIFLENNKHHPRVFLDDFINYRQRDKNNYNKF